MLWRAAALRTRSPHPHLTVTEHFLIGEQHHEMVKMKSEAKLFLYRS
jgi:hypothetical protein